METTSGEVKIENRPDGSFDIVDEKGHILVSTQYQTMANLMKKIFNHRGSEFQLS